MIILSEFWWLSCSKKGHLQQVWLDIPLQIPILTLCTPNHIRKNHVVFPHRQNPSKCCCSLWNEYYSRTSEIFLHYVQVGRECQALPKGVWAVIRLPMDCECPSSTFFVPQGTGHQSCKKTLKVWITDSSLFQHKATLICWFFWLWLEAPKKIKSCH